MNYILHVKPIVTGLGSFGLVVHVTLMSYGAGGPGSTLNVGICGVIFSYLLHWDTKAWIYKTKNSLDKYIKPQTMEDRI
jgi:hypothetical protein